MGLVITKDSKNGFDITPVAHHVRGSGSRACDCGQQLDVCTRTHCPRCGRTLHR